MAAERPKTAQILVVPLLLMLGGLIWYQLRPRGSVPMLPSAPLVSPDASSVVPESPLTPEDPATLPTVGRDPFQWPAALQEAVQASTQRVTAPDTTTPQVETIPMPTLRVQGVFWGTNPHRAIVNDQILTEGDTIEGVRIVSIDRAGIAVEFQGTQSVLSMPTPGASASE